MKKKIVYMAVLCILLSLLANGTLAYFTAEDTARNVITTGKVDIVIEEWQQTENGLEKYPSEPIAIMPATTVSKIVTVKNLDAECFIRARLDMIVKDLEGNVMKIEPEMLEKIITLNMNTANWTYRDGWWYCNNAVKNGKATEALMTEVVFDGPNMTNEYQNCTVEIHVNAQAVQSANNKTTVLEAKGWPEEE